MSLPNNGPASTLESILHDPVYSHPTRSSPMHLLARNTLYAHHLRPYTAARSLLGPYRDDDVPVAKRTAVGNKQSVLHACRRFFCERRGEFELEGASRRGQPTGTEKMGLGGGYCEVRAACWSAVFYECVGDDIEG